MTLHRLCQPRITKSVFHYTFSMWDEAAFHLAPWVVCCSRAPVTDLLHVGAPVPSPESVVQLLRSCQICLPFQISCSWATLRTAVPGWILVLLFLTWTKMKRMGSLECMKLRDLEYWGNGQIDSPRICGIANPQKISTVLCKDDQVGNGSIEMQQLVCGMTGGDGGAWTWRPYLPINTYKIFANKI